ncbi:MAG: hypothetical protein HOO06_12075 [Bdellovibrionaceae bacterium]|nr:hypothetical protein [Pseudobdellovibrionaceae bacterium]
MGQLLQRYFVISVSFFVLFFHQTLLSSTYFDNLKDDKTVPQHCKTTVLSHFDVSALEMFTISLKAKNGRSRFTFQYPLNRGNANYLWYVMKSYVKNGSISDQDKTHIAKSEELTKNFNALMDSHKVRGFRFGSEGEVLELLAHVALQKSFDADNLNVFVTGSLQYREFKGSSAMGELDVLIADKDTCKVLAYGEAKLGVHRSSKAWSQVHRFERFLKAKDINPVFSVVQDDWMGAIAL